MKTIFSFENKMLNQNLSKGFGLESISRKTVSSGRLCYEVVYLAISWILILILTGDYNSSKKLNYMSVAALIQFDYANLTFK